MPDYQPLFSDPQLSEALVHAIPLPVFYKDPQGRYLGCNTAFCKMVGIYERDIIGKTVFDLNPEHLAVRKPESGFVGLRAFAFEKFLILFVIDAGKVLGIEIEHRLSDDVSFVDAEHLAERRIATQVTTLGIFIKHGKRYGVDQGFGQLRIAQRGLIIRHGFVPGLQWP